MTNCWLVCIFIAQYVIVCVWWVFVCNCVCMCVEIMSVCRKKNHFWHKKWNRGKLLNINYLIKIFFSDSIFILFVDFMFLFIIIKAILKKKKRRFHEKNNFCKTIKYNNWTFGIKVRMWSFYTLFNNNILTSL